MTLSRESNWLALITKSSPTLSPSNTIALPTSLLDATSASNHSFATKNGVESVELAIYNYDERSGPVSAKGDFGSLIFDGLGRVVGLLHSVKFKGGGLTDTHVTYATLRGGSFLAS